MLKLLSALIAAIIALSVAAASGRALLPQEMEGSMMPYDFSLSDPSPVWGDSLMPVYVAHVARHGARYITSPKKLERIRAAVAKASEEGSLTKRGKEFGSLLSQVETATGKNWGDLSATGCEEERRLAADLSALLPKLLKNARVKAYSTYVPRVVKTMYEYCRELAVLNPAIDISTGEGKRYNDLLRCFTADTAYAAYREHGNWEEVYDRFVDSIVPVRPAVEILGSRTSLSGRELRHLTLDIYDILQSLRAFGMEAPDERFMTAGEYRACWEADNLLHYLRNSITPLSSLAGKATSPLLARIIYDADNALGKILQRGARKSASLSDKTPLYYSATLYFGHAETLMPLLSLMKVEGCHDSSGDFATLSQRWKDYEIVPLGANLDIILLGSPSGRTYASLRLNGKFIAPMPDGRAVVPWGEYREYLSLQIARQQ